MIAASIDGDISRLTDGGALVWMPAHSTPAAIGRALKSDHSEITAADWRANRLADALAKAASGEAPDCAAIDQLLHSAEVLVEHEAAVLGASTALSNGCEVSIPRTDGGFQRVLHRDSTGLRRVRPMQPQPVPVGAVATAAPEPELAFPCADTGGSHPTRTCARTTCRRRAASQRRKVAHAALQTLIAQKGESLRPSSMPPAQGRLDALLARVRERAAV